MSTTTQEEVLIQCSTYKFTWWQLLVPNYDIIDLICSSNDKTYLFITSFVRCILVAVILELSVDYIPEHKYTKYVNGFLIGYLLVNVFLAMAIIFKKQKIEKPNDAI